MSAGPRHPVEVKNKYDSLVMAWRDALARNDHSLALAIGSQIELLCWCFNLKKPNENGN